jgi:hypothetical protein
MTDFFAAGTLLSLSLYSSHLPPLLKSPLANRETNKTTSASTISPGSASNTVKEALKFIKALKSKYKNFKWVDCKYRSFKVLEQYI